MDKKYLISKYYEDYNTNNFESYAEFEAYQYIKKIADRLEKPVVIQYPIYSEELKDWVIEKLEDGKWDDHDIDNYIEITGNSVTYTYLKYRLDFYFPIDKICIEIDGDKYHDFEKDIYRDLYLSRIGIKTIRITARQVFNREIINILNEHFRLGQTKLYFFFN